MQNLYSAIEKVQKCTTLEQIHQVCSDFCLDLGFDFFHYGARIPVSFSNPRFIFVSGYPDNWWEHYIDNEFLYKDPTVIHCSNKVTPFFWNNITEIQKNSLADNNVILEARDFGLRSGLSIPVHSATGEAAIFSMVSREDDKKHINLIHTNTPISYMFANYLHEMVISITESGINKKSTINLTQREKDCLCWSADGKTAWEISQILNISERTVVFHIHNATNKLGVTNKAHAIARAVLEGHISPFS